MSDQNKTNNTTAPQVGGTSTPIAGSKSGVGEKDPVVTEEATGQAPPAENVVDEDDQGANRNPDAPQHGGYGRPV
jgi:hypothetical protein